MQPSAHEAADNPTPSSDDRAVLSINVLIGLPSFFLSASRIPLSLLKYHTLGSVTDVEAWRWISSGTGSFRLR